MPYNFESTSKFWWGECLLAYSFNNKEKLHFNPFHKAKMQLHTWCARRDLNPHVRNAH